MYDYLFIITESAPLVLRRPKKTKKVPCGVLAKGLPKGLTTELASVVVDVFVDACFGKMPVS